MGEQEREREREGEGKTTTADPRAGLPEEPIVMHKSIHRLRKDTSGKCCLPYHKRNGRLSYAAAKYGHFAVSKALAGATSSRVCTCRGCQLRVAQRQGNRPLLLLQQLSKGPATRCVGLRVPGWTGTGGEHHRGQRSRSRDEQGQRRRRGSFPQAER